MDIAFVSNVVFPFIKGGAEKRIHEVGRRLAAGGHSVTVYGRHFWDGPSEILYEGMTLRAAAPGVVLYNDDGQRSISEAISFSAQLIPTLRTYIKNHDIVVASVFPYFPVLSSEFCTLLTDTPLVTTWHEVWKDYWDDYLGNLGICGRTIEHLTARVPQHPVAVSNITADRLATIGPARENIDVVPNGIDVNQIQNAPLPVESYRKGGKPGFDILFAGRLISDKNVDILINAFDRVTRKHDATLGIIGDGPELESLEHQAGEIEHSHCIEFLGFLDEYEDVLGHMQAARVFASPSTREGFGITYAEAMAADCTVVAASHPKSAASEVIGDAGYVVKPTIAGVANALDKALSDERPPVEPTAHVKQFDWDSVANQAEAVYRKVVEEK